MRKKSQFLSNRILYILLFVINIAHVSAQNITIRGHVSSDVLKEPIIGATIRVKGNINVGTITDIDGNYTLSNVPANGVLEFSYVGMKTQVIPVEGKTTINVTFA